MFISVYKWCNDVQNVICLGCPNKMATLDLNKIYLFKYTGLLNKNETLFYVGNFISNFTYNYRQQYEKYKAIEFFVTNSKFPIHISQPNGVDCRHYIFLT